MGININRLLIIVLFSPVGLVAIPFLLIYMLYDRTLTFIERMFKKQKPKKKSNALFPKGYTVN